MVATLGNVIDGFAALSDSDKAMFMALNGFVRSAAQAASGALVPQTAEAVHRVLPYVPLGAVTGVIPRTAAAQQASGLVPVGSTMNPKTGKVFKLVPAKERTAERLRLESAKEQARVALSELCSEHNIEHLDDGSVSSEHKQSVLTDYNNSLSEFQAAKAALAAYKAAHPQEFAVQPPRKGRNKS